MTSSSPKPGSPAPTSAHDRDLDVRFTGPMIRERNSGWLCVAVPNSEDLLKTRKAVKISGTVDGQPLDATLLPMGDGTHMLPLRASLRRSIGKTTPGDPVTVHLQRRHT